MKDFSRRNFIKLISIIGLGAAVSWLWPWKSIGQEPEEWHIFLPLIRKGDTLPPPPEPPSIGHKVVHIYSANATNWDYASEYFFQYINQTQVNDMVDQGVKELTGATTVADAWRILLSAVTDYVPGKGIAIKVNFNNYSQDCNDMFNKLDAVIEPVNAVIRGLKLMGVQESDIWVFDASRNVPYWFVNGCDYPNVKFFNSSKYSACVTPVTWNSTDPSTRISFFGGGLADDRVPDSLVEATYLINMPVLRAHGSAGVTLGFKNHFGSITDPESLHDHVYLSGVSDPPDWSPLLDIYKNSNIFDKTILTIGDGLFGSWQGNGGSLPKWGTFKNNLGTDAPNSLFFAVDPVAIDSVMSDFIKVEKPSKVEDWAVNYLRLAEDDGLGIFEQGDPWGSGYSQIDYVRLIL